MTQAQEKAKRARKANPFGLPDLEFSNHKPKAKKLDSATIKRMEKHYSKFW